MNWNSIGDEVAILVNWFLGMIFASFLMNQLTRMVCDSLCVVIKLYFEQKKNYLIELSKSDIPDREGQVRRGSTYN